MRERSRIQQNIKRDCSKYAKWFVENHWPQLEQAFTERYKGFMDMTQRQKEILVEQVLKKTLQSILRLVFEEHSEVAWNAYDRKPLIYFLVDREFLNFIKSKKNGSNTESNGRNQA